MNLENAMREEVLRRIEMLEKRFHIKDTMREYFLSSNTMVVDFTNKENEEYNEENIEVLSKIYKDFISKNKVVVYYMFIENITIDNYTDKVIHILYVDEYKEDWENARLDKNDEILAYTYNISLKMPEFGYIKLAKKDNEIGRIG